MNYVAAPLPIPLCLSLSSSLSPSLSPSLFFSFVKTLSDSCHKQRELRSDSDLSVSIFEIQSRPINPLDLKRVLTLPPLSSCTLHTA